MDIGTKKNIKKSSVAETERSCLESPLLRWLRSHSRVLVNRSGEPELPFNEALAGSFRKTKKKSLVLIMNMKSVHFTKTNMIQKRFILINFNKFFQRSKWKRFVSGVGAAKNSPFLPGARVGSRSSDVQSRPKKWRLRNTTKSWTRMKWKSHLGEGLSEEVNEEGGHEHGEGVVLLQVHLHQIPQLKGELRLQHLDCALHRSYNLP